MCKVKEVSSWTHLESDDKEEENAGISHFLRPYHLPRLSVHLNLISSENCVKQASCSPLYKYKNWGSERLNNLFLDWQVVKSSQDLNFSLT